MKSFRKSNQSSSLFVVEVKYLLTFLMDLLYSEFHESTFIFIIVMKMKTAKMIFFIGIWKCAFYDNNKFKDKFHKHGGILSYAY